MHQLSDDIYTYYFQNFDQLPFDKQFHFASRLYLWSGDIQAKQAIDRLRPVFTGGDAPAAAFQKILEETRQSPVHGSKNAAELRRPHFEKYPRLKMQLMLLFRLAFLRSVYGIDARDALYEICSREELAAQFDALLHDQEALAILSTHAINFLYLYGRFVVEDDAMFDPAVFLSTAHASYDMTDKLHLQLFIYLYTHCVIGESTFYSRALPPTHLAVYKQMMSELETVIGANFDDINLDNKFEFLVCAQLAGHASALQPRIFDEAGRSLSETGTFLIDRHNTNPQADNASLDKSEHRNVLFLMATRPFQPLA